MKKVWYHYLKWEDFQQGMYKTISGQDRKAALAQAIEFTGNPELYGDWMLAVVEQWPISCEHNLTDIHSNRQAWIGHAACCLARGIPEDITREAWAYLSQNQQDEANAKADLAIKLWEAIYEDENSRIHSQMDDSGVSRRHSR